MFPQMWLVILQDYHTSNWLSYMTLVILQVIGYLTSHWLSNMSLIILHDTGYLTNDWLSYKSLVIIQVTDYLTWHWLSYMWLVILQVTGYFYKTLVILHILCNTWMLSYVWLVILQVTDYLTCEWKPQISQKQQPWMFKNTMHNTWCVTYKYSIEAPLHQVGSIVYWVCGEGGRSRLIESVPVRVSPGSIRGHSRQL